MKLTSGGQGQVLRRGAQRQTRVGWLALLGLALSIVAGLAQTFTTLKEFGVTNNTGANSGAGLTLSGGVLYGTMETGGSTGAGTVFKMNTNGTGFTVLVDFGTNGASGVGPQAALTLSDGVLYGTTYSGGYGNGGTVFKVNTNGTGYTELNSSSLGNPEGGVILADGVLYGTAVYGEDVFKINTDGTGYSVLKEFPIDYHYDPERGPDGKYPAAGLVLSDGVLYGTTFIGGSFDLGTVFKVNTNGTGFAVLKHFSGSDGSHPLTDLLLCSNVLYGTTTEGGASPYAGTVFRINTDGTGFAVLKTYTGGDGNSPWAGLALSGNALYGTTYGSDSGAGTVFRLNTDGTGYTVLKSFTGDDGANPLSVPTVSGGVLYATTRYGGSLGGGTVFKMDLFPPTSLTIQPLGNAVVLSWPNPAFALQAAPTASGVYTNIPGALSPYTNAITAGQQYFRLIGQ